MNHPNYEEWAPYIFGEARPTARRRLGAHLRDCAECRSEIEAWRRSLGRLNAWKLPKTHRYTEAIQPVLKWAIAAALVLGVGFGVGRLMSPGISPVGDRPSQIEAEVKAALMTELRHELRQQLAADFQNVFERAQSQSSNALAALEARLTEASEVQTRQLVQVLTTVLDRAREEDRRAVLALFRDVEKQNVAAFVAVRKDLEGLASLTDDEIRRTRLGLVHLAEQTRPNAREMINQ